MKILLRLAITAGLLWFAWSRFPNLGTSAGTDLEQDISDAGVLALVEAQASYVTAAQEQFKLALKSGDQMETCVRAGLLAAAYSQVIASYKQLRAAHPKEMEGASDPESLYFDAKRLESRYCKAAGVDLGGPGR